MHTFESESGHVVVSLETGDLFLESIQTVCEDHDIETGYVASAIGTLRNLNVHYLTTDDLTASRDERNTVLELDGCWEVSGVNGVIAAGDPHLHVTADDGERTVAGHLEDGCEINALGEVVIRRLEDLDLERTPNEFGVSILGQRKESDA